MDNKFQVTKTGLTIGEGDRAMLPMEAFNSSTEGATNSALSASRGLILILNFLRLSSSSSDSLDEKKWDFSLGVRKQVLRKAPALEHGCYGCSSRTKKQQNLTINTEGILFLI